MTKLKTDKPRPKGTAQPASQRYQAGYRAGYRSNRSNTVKMIHEYIYKNAGKPDVVSIMRKFLAHFKKQRHLADVREGGAGAK